MTRARIAVALAIVVLLGGSAALGRLVVAERQRGSSWESVPQETPRVELSTELEVQAGRLDRDGPSDRTPNPSLFKADTATDHAGELVFFGLLEEGRLVAVRPDLLIGAAEGREAELRAAFVSPFVGGVYSVVATEREAILTATNHRDLARLGRSLVHKLIKFSRRAELAIDEAVQRVIELTPRACDSASPDQFLR